MKKSQIKKNVLIVGSGIAGLSAARRVLDRGYQVSIFDSNSFLGGRLIKKLIVDLDQQGNQTQPTIELPQEIELHQKRLIQGLSKTIKTSPLKGVLVLDPSKKKEDLRPIREPQHLLENQILFGSDFWDYWWPLLKLSPQAQATANNVGPNLKSFLSMIQQEEIVFIQETNSSLHDKLLQQLAGATIRTHSTVKEMNSHSVSWRMTKPSDPMNFTEDVTVDVTVEKGAATLSTSQQLEIEPETALSSQKNWLCFTHSFRVKNIDSPRLENLLLLPKDQQSPLKQLLIWNGFLEKTEPAIQESILSVTLFRKNLSSQEIELEIKKILHPFAPPEGLEIQWLHSQMSHRSERVSQEKAPQFLIKDMEGVVYTQSFKTTPSLSDLFESGVTAADYAIDNILEYETNNYEKKQAAQTKKDLMESSKKTSSPQPLPSQNVTAPKSSSPKGLKLVDPSSQAPKLPVFLSAIVSASSDPILSVGNGNLRFF